MAFIRTKKIKGKEYAYIVENVWRKRGKKVKQKTKKYLGRVYRFDKTQDIDFFEFHKISDIKGYIIKEKEEIIFDLVKWELFKHGFKEEKRNFVNDNCLFNGKKILNKRGNNIALGFNEGFLSNYAISKLINFKAEYEEDAYNLAKLFIESGINVPKDIFVGIFNKYNVEIKNEFY